jgi:hypothetical protein
MKPIRILLTGTALRRVLLAGLVLSATPARSAIYCVATHDGLVATLLNTSTNDQDDEIRLRIGTFPAPTLGGFAYAPDPGGGDAHTNLVISGGWSGAACTRYAGLAEATVLEGSGSRVLTLVAQGGGKYEVQNLTIANGVSGAGLGALTMLSGGSQAPVLVVERVRFVGNQGFAALVAESDKMIRLVGSLFAENDLTLAGGGSAVVRRTGTNGNSTYVLSNTITANQGEDGSFAGLRLENWGEDSTLVIGNIFWGNEGGDALLFGKIQPFSYNDVGIVDGLWFGTGNIQVDPLFSNPAAGDFRLADGSPLIDSSINTGLGYPPASDIWGNVRPVDMYDRGAHEFRPEIFSDGFESGDTSAWTAT